jgi:hypothetical protein
MAEDIIKPKGPLKRSSPDSGGANPRLTPVLAIVKDNVDPKRMGQIMVYLTDNSGLDPENKDNWRPVRFLSPYFGFTRPDSNSDDLGSYKTNPSSYGMWMAPPDIGTTVLCLFVDGDLNYGFYIGCVPEPEALQMVPAIGATDNIVPNEGEAQSYGGALRLPVTNINTNNKGVADSSEYLTSPKPIHSYSSAIMFQQGILRDPVRGPISSSSQRETPSRVGWGVSTPGRPIYEGGFDDKSIADNLKADQAQNLRVVARRGGHTIVMDDGDIIGRDNLVRIRTSLGHQILMSDDGQTLMLLHSNGQSYIELGKEGTVDIYSTNSINLRTQGDLNLHADNNVNIHATKNLNIQGENIQFNTEKEFKGRVGTDYSVFTQGKHLTKATGAMSMESAGDISVASTAIAYINGSKVNLNSGQTGTKPQEVPAIDKILHTDTLFDSVKGFLAAPAKLVSITSRAPAHAPWANAGQGVDVKTDLNASTSLPAAPPASVQNTNTASQAALDNPVSTATAASVPSIPAASPALNADVTSAIAGSVAQTASVGPLANAVSQGTAIGQTAQGVQAAVGKYALTATQLQSAGTIKPGSAALVNALAQSTGNVQTSLTQNLFTGQEGAQSLPQLVGSVTAQGQTLSKTLTQAQSSLQSAGAISGAETASQIGGVVLAATNNGLSKTLDAVKSLGSPGAAISGATDQINGVVKDIAGGNFASALGEGVSGALSGIQNSVDALAKSPSLAGVIDQAKGVAAGAFSAISASLKPLEAGKPQNLTAIAKKAAEETMSVSEADITNIASQTAESLASQVGTTLGQGGLVDAAGGFFSNLTGAAKSALPNAGNLANSLVQASGALGSVTGSSSVMNAVSQLSSVAKLADTASTAFASPSSLLSGASATQSLGKTATNLASGLVTSGVSAIAGGLSKLPGGQSAAGAITNLAQGALPSLPGTDTLKDAIKGAAASAMTGVDQLTGAAADLLKKAEDPLGGLKGLLSAGLPAGAASQLESAMSSLASAGSGIKIPSIALNTTDRGEIAAAVTSQLGDPDIPAPNFGEIDEATEGIVADIEQQKFDYIIEQGELVVKRLKAETKVEEALDAYLTAQFDYPPGDPAIDAAETAYKASIVEWEGIIQELEDLDKKYPAIAAAVYGNRPVDETETIEARTLGSSTTGIGSAT